jgi:hypothetical protein
VSLHGFDAASFTIGDQLSTPSQRHPLAGITFSGCTFVTAGPEGVGDGEDDELGCGTSGSALTTTVER